MALKSISVRGFRNLQPTTIEFAAGPNYLFGPNGAGKTNLLEAIHYLAIGRSFRRCLDSELLGFDKDVFVIAGSDEAGETAEIRFDGKEKRVLRNDIKVEKLSEFLGWLPVVVLVLDDIELVRGSPGLRRGFIDMAAAKSDREYIGLLGEYRRAVMQLNRLLEESARGGSRSAGVEELQVWEEELIRTGVPVYEHRTRLVRPLLENAGRHFERLCGGPAQFLYLSTVDLSRDSAESFRDRLEHTRPRARQVGHVLTGPHRDDIRISRGENELRKYGSVGEQRLAGIALRLAEADMLLKAGRQRPVFLLDEVASELDENRSRLVLEMVAERGQMVYAAARRTVRLEVRSPKDECRSEGTGLVEDDAARDAGPALGAQGSRVQGFEGPGAGDSVRDRSAPLDPGTPGPLDPSAGKEFHVEAGLVSQVS